MALPIISPRPPNLMLLVDFASYNNFVDKYFDTSEEDIDKIRFGVWQGLQVNFYRQSKNRKAESCVETFQFTAD